MYQTYKIEGHKYRSHSIVVLEPKPGPRLPII